ncbi:hypothetical protein VE04_01500 [Pseudogymnoascus sp. 24MN13]|nr:hypothetical protein VE04_01500 [Pseudogymnoascus sp. 24MN13]
MYTIAPRVGSRCQYVCTSCLNATIRRGENASPRLLRQSSNVAAATHNAENESPKAESTGARSLDSWLQKAAKKHLGPAQADQSDKIAAPLKPITKRRSKSSPGDKARETAVTLEPSNSGKGSKTITKKRSKGVQVNPEDQTAEPLQTSNSNEGVPGTDGKPPPSSSKKRRTNKNRQKKLQALYDISVTPSSDTGSSRTKGPKSVGQLVRYTVVKAPRGRSSTTVRNSPTQSSHPVARRVLNTVIIRPSGTPLIKRVQGRKRGQLLTYLYSITSSSANRVAKTVLMKVLKEKKLLNKRGLELAQGGEDIFKDAAREQLEKADRTLSTTLLKTYENLESALKNSTPEAIDAVFKPLKEGEGYSSGSVHAQALKLVPVEKPQPPVPGLVCGLERVLFNQGVYRLRDPHTRVYNFDPYLESITPVKEFDYNALKEYITSSRDKTLIDTAVAEGSKYTGSTSSMTSALAHFHYLLSKWRPVNHDQLSRGFPRPLSSFTAIQRAPASIFLRRRDGVYAIDANKGFDTSNVLQWLGKSMEKFLTSDKEEYIKYRKENSHALTDDDKNSPESYHYTTFGDFLMRSQLDAHDPRLPGTGMYDLKTRAVISIRRDATDYEKGLGYEITSRYGEYDSYEREFYDMSRSAFLKYSLQVRMGRMDGIFVAFHNTERIFGFQYLPLPDMDQSLHGSNDTTLGDSEFKETNIEQIQEYERRVIGLDADGQEAVLRAAIRDAAEAVNADDQNEIFEDAFNHLDQSASVETIRNAFGKVEKGTPVEAAMNKMLDLMVARAEREDPEAMAHDVDAAVAESSGENADTAATDEARNCNTSSEGDVEGSVGRLAVFKLNIRNFVNGHQVVRPDKLKATDDWEVKYCLEEMTGNIETLYASSVKRRKESLGKSHVSSYMSQRYGGDIQDNVSMGKEYRKEMDRLDEKHGVKVYDKQEFLDFESLEKREEKVRKDVEEEIEELKSLKEEKEQAAVKV